MMRLLTLLTVLSTVCHPGQAADPEPQNTVAMIKNDTILRCRQYSDDVVWQFYDVGKTRKDNGNLISARGKIQPQFIDRYSLNRILPGQHDLLIKDVQSKDAGIYECAKGQNNQPSAHLTVVHDPECSIRGKNGVVSYVTQRDTIRLSCSVQLAGHCQPTMEWSLDDGTIIQSSTSIETNSKLRTAFLESDFTVNAHKEIIWFKFTISFTCPPNDYDFKNLSSINPEYKHVWRSHDFRVITEPTESESRTLFPITATTTEGNKGDGHSGGKDWIIYMNVLLGLLVVVFISGTITRMVIRKQGEKNDSMALRPYLGAANLSQPSEYFEIEIPDSINTDESVTTVNPGRKTIPRSAETNPIIDGPGIRLTEIGQSGEKDLSCSSITQLSNKQNNSRAQKTTLPNQQKNKNYVELDSSTREARSAPSVYKRLSNKKQQLVQSSQVTHTSEVEDEPQYCNVNRPRLPTPESNNSVESNMDQLAA